MYSNKRFFASAIFAFATLLATFSFAASSSTVTPNANPQSNIGTFTVTEFLTVGNGFSYTVPSTVSIIYVDACGGGGGGGGGDVANGGGQGGGGAGCMLMWPLRVIPGESLTIDVPDGGAGGSIGGAGTNAGNYRIVRVSTGAEIIVSCSGGLGGGGAVGGTDTGGGGAGQGAGCGNSLVSAVAEKTGGNGDGSSSVLHMHTYKRGAGGGGGGDSTGAGGFGGSNNYMEYGSSFVSDGGNNSGGSGGGSWFGKGKAGAVTGASPTACSVASQGYGGGGGGGGKNAAGGKGCQGFVRIYAGN